MTATQASTSEFDLFGPWIDVVETPDQVPPLYRDHPLDLDASELVLKFPRNIARRDAHPDMDLYDHLVVVDATTLTMLSRRTGVRSDRGYDTVRVRHDEIVAVRDAVSILDGTITVTTRSGNVVTVLYNGSSRDNVRRLVELLRAHVTTGAPTQRGAAVLRAGRATADPVAALDLGPTTSRSPATSGRSDAPTPTSHRGRGTPAATCAAARPGSPHPSTRWSGRSRPRPCTPPSSPPTTARSRSPAATPGSSADVPPSCRRHA